ncbi:MAG: hypothetical protein QOI81_2141 [Actinomycetota bacterium]|jgi:hypothetical protein|nr:hypothetical protein [Actinomycetota bacterium]
MIEWAYLNAEGAETGTSEPFDTQEAAESWFAENWQPLATGGTADVILRNTEDGVEVYKMSLAPE